MHLFGRGQKAGGPPLVEPKKLDGAVVTTPRRYNNSLCDITKNQRVARHRSAAACTCEVKGEGDEAVVFAEDAQRLLPLHQREEVIRHRLAIEEVVDAQQEVPARAGTRKKNKEKQSLRRDGSGSAGRLEAPRARGCRVSSQLSLYGLHH